MGIYGYFQLVLILLLDARLLILLSNTWVFMGIFQFNLRFLPCSSSINILKSIELNKYIGLKIGAIMPGKIDDPICGYSI